MRRAWPLLAVLLTALPARAQGAARPAPADTLLAVADRVYDAALAGRVGEGLAVARVDTLARALADSIPRVRPLTEALARNIEALGGLRPPPPCDSASVDADASIGPGGPDPNTRPLIVEIRTTVDLALEALEPPLAAAGEDRASLRAQVAALCAVAARAERALGLLALHQSYLRVRADLREATRPPPAPPRPPLERVPVVLHAPTSVVVLSPEPVPAPRPDVQPALRIAVGALGYPGEIVGGGLYGAPRPGLLAGAHVLYDTGTEVIGAVAEAGARRGALAVLAGVAYLDDDVSGVDAVALTGTVLYLDGPGLGVGLSLSTAHGMGVRLVWAR